MGCTIGERSLLCSFEVLFPETTWRFFEAGAKRDLDELFRITEFFMGVDNRLFAHCERDMIDGSFDKTFIWLRNPSFSNRLLPPYNGLSEEESRVCRPEIGALRASDSALFFSESSRGRPLPEAALREAADLSPGRTAPSANGVGRGRRRWGPER